ncbi:hypothetical protein GJ496_010953 [Pomphorhynchus laevis]|nr:hypothetical protein GJ496_010953 [Pomphorhynchus laevis]
MKHAHDNNDTSNSDSSSQQKRNRHHAQDAHKREDIADKTSLIVNYLPQSMKEKELWELFKSRGQVKSCRLMYDKCTGYSFGYGFVQYVEEEDAARAISELNGLKIGNKTLKVSYSRPQSSETRGSGLCIRNLPEHCNEHDLNELLSTYGSVIQTRLLRDQNTGHSRCMAFVIMSKRSEALAAIKSLQNKVLNGSEGSVGSVAITVNNKNTSKQVGLSLELINNNTRKKQTLLNCYGAQGCAPSTNMNSLDPIVLPDLIRYLTIFQNKILFTVGCNGGAVGTKRTPQSSINELLSSCHSCHATDSMINNDVAQQNHHPVLECNHVRPTHKPSCCSSCSFNQQKENDCEYCCYHHHHHQDKRLCLNDNVSTVSNQSVRECPTNQPSENDASSSIVERLKSIRDETIPEDSSTEPMQLNTMQAANPLVFNPISNVIKQICNSLDPQSGGFIVYIFGIGPDPDEFQLKKLFQRYGRVIRVDIIRNLTTGQSKGYAFVTMVSYDQAVAAITALNGSEFSGRKLQVRFKA